MTEPIFKSIFGKSWDDLPIIFKKHYALHPYTEQQIITEGELNVMSKAPLTWFAVIMRLMGQIPVTNEDKVPVTVYFKSDKTTKAFHFIREFRFNKIQPYIFRSSMLQIQGSDVIEIMRFGLGWKMQYTWDGEKVVLTHRGYVFKLFNRFIPVPLTLFLGSGYAEEHPIDDNTFDMITYITHPWWGKIYQYKGRFKINDV